MLTAEEPSGSYDGLSAANCLSFSRKKIKKETCKDQSYNHTKFPKTEIMTLHSR